MIGAGLVVPAHLAKPVLIGFHQRCGDVAVLRKRKFDDNAKSVAVDELGDRELPPQLFEKLPDAKVMMPFGCVVHNDNPAWFHFRPPAAEITPDGFVCVFAVDMEKINAFVTKAFRRLIEAHAKQAGKPAV